jgi:hypothetical protein
MCKWLKGFFKRKTPRTFQSKDPMVGELATKIDRRYPGMVEGVNVQLYKGNGQKDTDIDVATKKSNIEVKSDGTRHLHLQLRHLKKVSRKEPIGYAPQITTDEKEKIKKDGIKVFRCDDCLIDYLGWKKRHPFCHRMSYRDVDCRKGKSLGNCYRRKGRK